MGFRTVVLCGMLYCGATSVVFAGTQESYQKHCARCHDAGILKAPTLGAVSARAQSQGIEVLRRSVVEGINRMPKKGGCFSCTNEQLFELVDWMVMTGSSD